MSVFIRELAPGDTFTAIPTRTRWTLERHDADDVSYAIRSKRPDEPGIANGDRDRFHPNVRVERGWGES